VKTGIHPEYVETTVTCTCGETFVTRSTAKNGSIHADVCSACHPFYTGKQKILDTGGRVARFEKRFGKKEEEAANFFLTPGAGLGSAACLPRRAVDPRPAPGFMFDLVGRTHRV